jgi:hypothetical protein
LKITPASIADAIGLGIDDTKRPSAGHKPVNSNSKPVTMKAPTALENGNPRVPDEIRRAAPGVLQTMEIGILWRQLSTIESSPYMVIKTKMPDVVCDLVAPKDASAAKTRPALAAVPVMDATEPARIGALWSEKRLID